MLGSSCLGAAHFRTFSIIRSISVPAFGIVLCIRMASRDDEYLGSIPRWNGDPSTFKRWEQEVTIFTYTCELTKKKCYAAILLSGLSGIAKTAALQVSMDRLRPFPSDADLKKDETWEAMNKLGITNLVKHLKDNLLRSTPIERGNRMYDFFSTQKYCRKRGMRMAEYNLLFQQGVDDLYEVDIKLADLPDILGWFYLRGAGLTYSQRESVLGKLEDATFPYDKLTNFLINMFPDIGEREKKIPLVVPGERNYLKTRF